jgi:hypothetical protein
MNASLLRFNAILCFLLWAVAILLLTFVIIPLVLLLDGARWLMNRLFVR